MKIIDLLNKIANGEEVPKQISVCGVIWNYVEGFGQYQNYSFQEMIKYLNGHYNDCRKGLVYKAIFNCEVEIIGDDTNENI